MKKIRVLVFPCGSEGASEIHQALRYSLHVDLYGASSIDDHGRFLFANYFGNLPNIADPAFDAAWIRLLSELQIDLVFATHDTVHTYLSERAAAMGFHLVNGDPDTSRVTRRKSLTYQALADLPATPSVYADPADVAHWPAAIKPDCGQGGQGFSIAHTASEAQAAMARIEDPLLVEYLPGQELSVDCFTSFTKELIWIGPRTRERVRAGITMRSELLEASAELREIAHGINARLSMRGPWFFQVKKDFSGHWKLLEVSCRVASTTAAARARGVNLPLMAVQDFMGRRLQTLDHRFVQVIDRNITTKARLEFHYDKIFIDLDDTLIIDGAAVPRAMAFVYQEHAKGKEIFLITRHAGDVETTLHRTHIPPSLFKKIIHLQNEESKADFIEPHSIFIDNAFLERLDVAKKQAIPVLDVDALEFFIN